MSVKVHPVPQEWKARAFVDDAKYREMYQRSIDDPDGFWAEHGKRIDWMTPFTKVIQPEAPPAEPSTGAAPRRTTVVARKSPRATG